jgi:hypothetical protein
MPSGERSRRAAGARRASTARKLYHDTVWSNSYSGTGAVADTANVALLDCRLLTQSISQIA